MVATIKVPTLVLNLGKASHMYDFSLCILLPDYSSVRGWPKHVA